MKKKVYSNAFNKYKNLPVTVKASLWFTLCMTLQKGIALITVPIFTRLMSTEEFGTVTIYQSWLNIITIICTLNLTYGGFYNGMIRYPDDKEGYATATFSLTTLMTAGWLVVYLFCHNYINKWFGLSTGIMLIMFAEIFARSAYEVWVTRKKYEFRYKEQSIATILSTVVTPIIGVTLVVLMEDKAFGRIISFATVYIILGIFCAVNLFKKSRRVYRKEYWKFTILFCVPLIPHFLSQTLLLQADRVMINTMVGTSEAGIYGFAQSIGTLIMIASNAINTSFMPWLYKKLKNKDYREIGKVANILLILMMFVVGIVALLLRELTLIMGGEKYMDAIYIIAPITMSVFFTFMYGLFCNVEMFFEKTKYVTYASVFAVSANIILNYIFIQRFGYIAAGYTTLICYIILCITHYICMRIVCKKENVEEQIYSAKLCLVLSIVVIVFTIVLIFINDYPLIRYFLAILLCVLLWIKRSNIINMFKMELIKK